MTTLVRIHRYGRSPISISVVWYAHGERQEAILPKGATVITETTADATAPELRIDGRRVLPPWALSLNGRHVLSNRALELRDPNPENLESLTEDPRDEYEARIRSENTAEYERELTDPKRRITGRRPMGEA